jgi:hypothetical protein
MKMRAKIIGIMMLGLLLPAPAISAAPAAPSPASASAPDEQAGDTADLTTPAAPAPAAPAAPAAPGKEKTAETPAGPIAPEQYYQLLLERQRLGIEYYREINKALDANAKDQKEALKAVAALEAERQKKTGAQFEKYQIAPADYYLNWVGTEVQAQRSKYLDEHPEVRDQIAANSSELKALESQVSERIQQLANRQPPPPPRKPQKG